MTETAPLYNSVPVRDTDTHRVHDQTYAPFVMFDMRLLEHEAYNDLSAHDIMVYIALKSFGGFDGTRIFPSIATLAKRAHCSPRTCHTSLNVLETVGLVRREQQFRSSPNGIGGVAQTVNTYVLPLINPPTALHEVQGGSARGAGGGLHEVQTELDPLELDPKKITPLPPTGGSGATPSGPKATPKAKAIPIDQRARAIYDDPNFTAFWNAYPRRDGKLNAAKAWIKRHPNPDTIGDILRVANWLKANTPPERVQYVPHASTFLNGERWNDETYSATRKAGAPAKNRPMKKSEQYAAQLEAERMEYGEPIQRVDEKMWRWLSQDNPDNTVDDFDWSVYPDGRKGKLYGQLVRNLWGRSAGK